MNYSVKVDGEWITPRRRGYYLSCCDCGLAHKLNFRLVGNNRIQFQAFRIKRRNKGAKQPFRREGRNGMKRKVVK